MSKEKKNLYEEGETKEEMIQLNEMYYNCTECSSAIEIKALNEKEIEFKCINNNHFLKLTIKEYINKMKKYNNKNINNDICNEHNNKYECYCLDCNKHLCKECLKLRNHISHNKNIIIEIQPNKKELNIIDNIINYYEDKMDNLEKEKLIKTNELNDELKESKNKLKEKNELKMKENKDKMEKELKIKNDEYSLNIKNIRNKCENEMNLIKYNYDKTINEIKNKYKKIEDYNNNIYKKELENLDNKYIKIIQNYNYNENIENINSIKKLNEIVYNTYNIYNNNYYNSININNILISDCVTKIYKNKDLNYKYEYENIMKIKNEKEKMNNKSNEYKIKEKKL